MIRTNTVLELKNLSYIFPDHKGITDVSLKIKQGEIYMLYGGHDAGKTLLLQMLIGTLIPQMGTIKLFGNSNYLQEKRRIGYVPPDKNRIVWEKCQPWICYAILRCRMGCWKRILTKCLI